MSSSTNLTINGNGSEELTMAVLGCGESPLPLWAT